MKENENKRNGKETESSLGKVGFIGAGKVGFTLGQYFAAHKINLSGYYSQHFSSAKEAAELTGSNAYEHMKELLENSDTLFITVPDGQIKEVWDHMVTLPVNLKDKTVCHASGSLSSEVFSGMKQLQVHGFSVHPLFAISDKLNSYKELSKCLFTLEGEEGPKRKELIELFEQWGNPVEVISAEQKALYHGAAVVVSNFVVGLSYLGSNMLMECGFSKENARQALLPIMEGNVENIRRQGAVEALTGPVERNDVTTICRHLQAFAKLPKESSQVDKDRLVKVYKEMTNLLVEVGQEKHQDFNYEKLKEVLENE